MSDMVTVDLKGFEGIDRELRKMSGRLRGDVLAQVLEQSSVPFVQDYRADAPSFLRRLVRVRLLSKTRNEASVGIGAKSKLTHLFEFGTRRRRTKGQGPVQFKAGNRGRIQEMGFARRAFDVNVRGWFGHVGRLLWKEVRPNGRS